MTLLNLVKVPVTTIHLSPGSHLLINDVTWEQYETLLTDLGEKRHFPRINYWNQTLEVMAPLPEHERAIVVIADLVKVMLRLQRRPWESLRSTTFKRLNLAGVEPDDCFYIQNQQAIIGKNRIDLTVDPPPDLAIESDVTSKTKTEAYRAIGVPELWIYEAGRLTIYQLRDDLYVESDISLIFPTVPIKTLIPQVVQRAKEIGSSQALLEFEDELRTQMEL
jgi:Uma2 family endonuclease